VGYTFQTSTGRGLSGEESLLPSSLPRWIPVVSRLGDHSLHSKTGIHSARLPMLVKNAGAIAAWWWPQGWPLAVTACFQLGPGRSGLHGRSPLGLTPPASASISSLWFFFWTLPQQAPTAEALEPASALIKPLLVSSSREARCSLRQQLLKRSDNPSFLCQGRGDRV